MDCIMLILKFKVEKSWNVAVLGRISACNNLFKLVVEVIIKIKKIYVIKLLRWRISCLITHVIKLLKSNARSNY